MRTIWNRKDINATTRVYTREENEDDRQNSYTVSRKEDPKFVYIIKREDADILKKPIQIDDDGRNVDVSNTTLGRPSGYVRRHVRRFVNSNQHSDKKD